MATGSGSGRGPGPYRAPARASSTRVAWVTPFEPRAANGSALRK